jgi:hypothetical protein
MVIFEKANAMKVICKVEVVMMVLCMAEDVKRAICKMENVKKVLLMEGLFKMAVF